MTVMIGIDPHKASHTAVVIDNTESDLSIYTNRDLRRIEQRIDTIPRRSLNWATANDIYTAAVAMTT